MPKDRPYHFQLSHRERKDIKKLQRRTVSQNKRTRYEIILTADEGAYGRGPLSYRAIAALTGACVATVCTTIQQYCSEGLEAATTPRRSPSSDTANLKATGDIEARIVAKACSQAPDGRARWTLTLLTEEMSVILEEPLSRATIGRALKRNKLRPHLNAYWCIPPETDADFVAHMEDVLDVYHRPYDKGRPVWCIDEKPYQILGERREPIPMRPGDVRKTDAEYERNGTVSIFCMIEPHTGRIEYAAKPTRTAIDFAEQIKRLVDEIEPDATKITLVMDNLNTHTIGSLYKAFKPEEARRLAGKLEIHYTPKHGSWLDIAEIGINIMTRECLDRRIPSMEQLDDELSKWKDRYDRNPSPVNWQFNNEKARVKLRRLYPDIEKHYADREVLCKTKEQKNTKSAGEPSV